MLPLTSAPAAPVTALYQFIASGGDCWIGGVTAASAASWLVIWRPIRAENGAAQNAMCS